MTVEIRILADTASEAREEMARLLGRVDFTVGVDRADPGTKQTVEERLVARVGVDKAAELALSDKSLDELAAIADGRAPAEPEQAEAPAFREFGKAPEGKTRRTKEEIAEDEEVQSLIDKGAFGSGADVEGWVREHGHAAVIQRAKDLLARKADDEAHSEKSNISASPEDRQDPENPADAEQDAADEQAEVDAARDPEAPLTLDDLRSAMNEFVEAKGMPTTQKEGPSIFEKALGKPPAGEAAWKLSLLNDATQEQLKAAIAAWKEAAGA